MGLEIAENPNLADPDPDVWAPPPRRAMDRALAYMRVHCHRRLPLAEVASVAHMSQFHFSRLFHQLVGVTFRDQLVRLRLRNAERMLRRDPSAPLRRVAAQAGFGTLRNLQDHYGRVYGCPPSQGRARALRTTTWEEQDAAPFEQVGPRRPHPRQQTPSRIAS